MIVGSVQFVKPRGMPNDNTWQWAAHFVVGGGPGHGYAETREQAEAMVSERFARWLQWAGLAVRSVLETERKIARGNLATYRDAMRMVREAIETHAPPGSMPSEEAVPPGVMSEAEAQVKGILAIVNVVDPQP